MQAMRRTQARSVKVAMFTAGALAVAALLLGPAVALAAPRHVPTSFSPIDGSGIGVMLSGPRGIAIDEVLHPGNIFVPDSVKQEVYVLGAEGGPPDGIAVGQLSGVVGVGEGYGTAAIDNSDSTARGDVYVAEGGSGDKGVRRFSLDPQTETYDAAGVLTASPPLERPEAVAVDPTTGDVCVADEKAEEIVEFDPSGAEVGRIAAAGHPLLGRSSSLAFDGSGHLFVVGRTGAGKVVARLTLGGAGEVLAENEVSISGEAKAVAVDLESDTLYVGVQLQVGTSFPNEIEEFDAGTLAPTGEKAFGEGQIGRVGAFAVDQETHDIYVADLGNHDVAVFTPLIVVPVPVTGEATGIEPAPGGGATLQGTVNPEGLELEECSFEYGLTQSYGHSANCAETPTQIGSGEVAVPVHAQVGSLAAGTYHFQLRVKNANGVFKGSDKTFLVPGPPAILHESADASETEADLEARIDPSGPATTYHFEYGPTTAYGLSTPTGTIPAGTEPVDVASHVAGLTPGATYHFRVVAGNAIGTEEGADQTFIIAAAPPPPGCPPSTLASPGFRSYLPECRAYELVSPPYTQGAQVISPGIGGLPVLLSSDGTRVAGISIGSFAGQPSGCALSASIATAYAMQRTAIGWQPLAIAPPCDRYPFETLEDADSGLDRFLFTVQGSFWSGETKEFLIREPDGSFGSVGRLSPGYASGAQSGYSGASADLSRIVVELDEPGNIGEDALWPGDTTIDGRASLYEFTGTDNAEPKLVAVENEGPLVSNQEAQPIGQCGSTLGAPRILSTLGGEGDRYNAISPSGFAVFFTVAPGPCSKGTETGQGPTVAEIYARVGGAHTLAISEPPLSVPGRRCTGDCRESQLEEGGHSRGPARFAGASADGRSVYFTTAQPLTDADTDETTDLYMATLDAGGVTGLVDVSRGQGPTPGEGALVQGVSRVSMDGSRVYFVAEGVLTTTPNANGEAAGAGADNLYLYDAGSGQTAFVARLAPADSADWSVNVRPVQASQPDGRFLLFPSEAHPLGTGDTSAAAQLFRYDAQTGQLVRVSVGRRGTYVCPQTGKSQVGYNCNGNVRDAQYAPQIQIPAYTSRSSAAAAASGLNITSDGTVFFESADALTPLAVNGYPGSEPGFANVYEYRDGDVYLISDGQQGEVGTIFGRPTDGTLLLGATVDGGGVLFASARRLVPQDTDSQVSLYDARVDGGFPAPAVAAGCDGADCRGSTTQPPPGGAAGTAGFAGPGNQKAAGSCPRLVRRARKLDGRARRLQRQAGQAGDARKSGRMRKAASRLSGRASKLEKQAGRCGGNPLGGHAPASRVARRHNANHGRAGR